MLLLGNKWAFKSPVKNEASALSIRFFIEAKISANIDIKDLKGLVAFCEDYQPRHALVVCQAPRKRIITTVGKTSIEVLPWRDFLEKLWMKKYLS